MRKTLLAVGAIGLFGALAPSAGAATTLGQTFPPDHEFGGAGVFIQSGSPGNSYTVPSNGVITSWSFEAAAGITPPIKLKVVRRVGGDDFLTVGDSQLETPMPGILNTWPTRIAVNTGDVLAHAYTGSTDGYRTGVGPDYITNEISGSPGDPSLDPPPGTTRTYESDFGDRQIDLAAKLEPDADHDGFGDETQDKCPTNGQTQGPCITGQRAAALKKCKKKHKQNHKAKQFRKCKKKANRLPV
jgi:hypothetical protein